MAYNSADFYSSISQDYAPLRYGGKDVYFSEENRFILNNTSKCDAILDLCSGPGTYLVPLTRLGYNIVGIELSNKMIAYSLKMAERLEVDIKVSRDDARCVNCPDNSFDNIICAGDSIGTLVNNADRMKLLKESYRLLKPGGKLLITIGNRYSSVKTCYMHIHSYAMQLMIPSMRKRPSFGQIQFTDYGEAGLHYNYSYKEACNQLQDCGFNVILCERSFHKFFFLASRR